MPTYRSRLVSAGLCLLLAVPAISTGATPAAPEASELTLEQIMADPDWIGNPPEDPYWSDDGRSIYYERQREGIGEQKKDLFRVDLSRGATGAIGEAVRIDPAERGRADAPGERNRQRTRKVYAWEGDIFVKDLKTGKVRQVTRTEAEESEPHFLADGRRVWFRRGDDLLVYDVESGLLSQPAELKLDKDPADKKEMTYLQEQQTRLFDVIRQKQEKEKREREEERALRRADPTRAPLPWYLGKEVRIETLSLSPSGDWLAVVTSPKRDESASKPSKLPQYVTESGNVETRDVRPKVGAEEPVPQSVLLLDLKNHERHDLDWAILPGVKEDPLKALREAAEARKAARKAEDEKKKPAAAGSGDAEKTADKPADKPKEPAPRALEVSGLSWSDDGRQLALGLRARDNKDRWIATWDTAGGTLTPRHRLTDAAWINWNFNEFGWLRDNETLWLLSEESGASQLYRLSTRTGEIRRLTPEGKYEISLPALSWDGRYLYYTANQEHPGKYDLWRVEVANARAEQLTRMGGGFTHGVLSPDESQMLFLGSSIARPDEVYVQAARPGAEARPVTRTRTPLFLAQDWTIPEIVPVPSTHGAGAIYARIYTPKDFDPARKYPAAVFVHGAGYLQEVTYGWSNYFREFMFSTFLTRHGYVVLDMDYRASAGYGRDWRTAIYRQMGTPELEDLQDGVAWIAQHKNVDPARVGVWGGSYGGFLTYMALFRQPDLFAAGAALRPVSDWAHYNEEYTANILNRPEIDPEAYEKSSPIEYAAGLRKPLLICDGMQDANVFFQDNVRLVQRLIELKKENFEIAIYPVEDHGFVQPTSWLDEYRRIFKLFETNLK
ncbi:MAG TPA: prolyl oligopeptidase family serine peptidase [Thermoanaerobaculia bacterium]|nr:prolyl oligopeptidase family serine peptidase [Thermoanaerobaculia bacterium]